VLIKRLLVLLRVALRVSQEEVRHVMCATTRHRQCMVNLCTWDIGNSLPAAHASVTLLPPHCFPGVVVDVNVPPAFNPYSISGCLRISVVGAIGTGVLADTSPATKT
jgi:hypothetical protein